MSVCVNFRTKKRLEPKQVFDELLKRGEQFIVTSDSFPCVKLGTYGKGLRGIEINESENGYEVRVCSFANRPDLMLYVSTICALESLAKTKPLYEDDEEQPIDNVEEFLNDEWIEEQMDISINMNAILMKHFGSPIVMDGLFFPICFGPNLAEMFKIDLAAPTKEDLKKVQDYLTGLQWNLKDAKNTSTRMAITNQNNPDDTPLGVSVVYVSDGKVQDFDFIHYAPLFCLMNQDTDEMTLIHIDNLRGILSSEFFDFMDDYQFVKKRELPIEEFKEMMRIAKLFQVDDLFCKPTYPGNGYDDKQSTFVLMWNPAISSVKLEDHVSSIPSLMTEHYNWSVREHEKAKKGDRFVLVRCGEGKTGIVMSGVFDSNPYQAGDWSGRGRQVFYMDMKPNFIADPDNAKIITTEELQQAIPSFDWRGGASGRLLTEEQARKLEDLLANYLPQFSNNVDCKTVNGFSLPQNNDF